jgi:hypothetical protein
MNADITYMLAMSCVLPALIGIYRYNKIHSRYHPFIQMMILAVLIETIIYISIKFPKYGGYWQLAVNIYTLLNFALFLYFTQINGYLSKKAMQWLFAVACFVSLLNYMYEHTILKTFFYLLCFVTAAMLIISIDILSRQTTEIKLKLVNNFWFWLSSSSIIYNAFTLLIFGLYFFALFSTPKGKAIGEIQHYANLVCYVFFAIAILKIPEKNN